MNTSEIRSIICGWIGTNCVKIIDHTRDGRTRFVCKWYKHDKRDAYLQAVSRIRNKFPELSVEWDGFSTIYVSP